MPQELKSLDVAFDDTSRIPVHYVNVVDTRPTTNSELFVTVGSIFPPDLAEIEEAEESGKIMVQPAFRFAMSGETSKKFIELMAKQMNILDELRSGNDNPNNDQ